MKTAFEIGVIVIILVVMLGMVSNYTEDISDKMIKTQKTGNIEKMLSEVLDNIVNNPGKPDNWEEYNKGTPGLAIVSAEGNVVANSVSYHKLIALGKIYDEFDKSFEGKIKTSLELLPQKSSISSVKIGDENEGEEIYSVNRWVKCDFYKKYVLKDFENAGKCNHNHKQSENSCNYFKVFKGNLLTSDYYLILDEDVEYIIDTTRVVKERYWQNPTSDVIYLNPKINFYDDTSAIVFIHLNKADAKAVLVSVPKGFDRSFLEYDYFRTNECQLILRGWY